MSSVIVCQCCKQSKAKISARKSELISSMNVIMCAACDRAGHEPRHIIVLAAKSHVSVADHVKSRRYCGKSLEAVEVVP